MIEVNPKFAITQNDTSILVYHVNSGEGLPKHEHIYSHLVFCHAGKIAVRKENKEVFMTADSQPVNLVANEWHEIEAVEDGTIFVNTFDIRVDNNPLDQSQQFNYFNGIRSNPGELTAQDQLELYLGTMIQKIVAETISSTV